VAVAVATGLGAAGILLWQRRRAAEAYDAYPYDDGYDGPAGWAEPPADDWGPPTQVFPPPERPGPPVAEPDHEILEGRLVDDTGEVRPPGAGAPGPVDPDDPDTYPPDGYPRPRG
jgi:hypothetical protein